MGNTILYSNSPIIRKSLWAWTFETGSAGGLRHIGGAVHPVGDGRPVHLGYGLELLSAWHWLTAHEAGPAFDAFFTEVRQRPVPTPEQGREVLRRFLAGKACRTAHRVGRRPPGERGAGSGREPRHRSAVAERVPDAKAGFTSEGPNPKPKRKVEPATPAEDVLQAVPRRGYRLSHSAFKIVPPKLGTSRRRKHQDEPMPMPFIPFVPKPARPPKARSR